MSTEATHIHIAKEAVIPGETLVYFGPRSGSPTGKAELRLRIKRLSMARGGVLMASFTLSGGRFAEIRSTADYLSIPEPKIASVFRKPLEEQESNGGRTVSYRLTAQSSISRESRETEFVFRPHRIILTDAERVSVTVVLELVDDGSDEGLPAPEVLGAATQTLAHVDSLVPGFQLDAPSHPSAKVAFPSAEKLTLKPRDANAHAVRAITGGPHALLGRVGSESTDRFLMRNKDGEPALLQDVEAKVAISLNAFAEGGSAFIDRNLDGDLSTGEAFPSVEGGGERRLTLPLEEFLGRSLPVYYSPPISPTGIQPDTVALCVAVNSTVGSAPKAADYGCAATEISYDAQPPQRTVGLRGGSSVAPSTLTLTCLDRWEACQILAECRSRAGTMHHAQLPTIAAGATEIYSASKLADVLAPAGFLEATSANPGHCLFHSSRELSVVQGSN